MLTTRTTHGAALPSKPLATGRVVHTAVAWAGGVPKHSRQRVFVSKLGCLGDRQASEWVASFGGHGGVDKAVCLFDAAVIESLAAKGHPIAPGAAGENITVAGAQHPLALASPRLQGACCLRPVRCPTPESAGLSAPPAGLPWARCAAPGALLQTARGVRLRISEVTAPCGTIKGCFLKGENSLVDARKHPGASRWYARVLADGWVAVGDEVFLLEPPTEPPADAALRSTRSAEHRTTTTNRLDGRVKG